MRHATSTAWLAMLVGGLLASASPARAADDTFVSVTGIDAGACTVTAPCRTLNYAIAQTTTGGTIIILSSGHYAPVTITKSVYIMADGVEAVLTGIGACEAVVCINAGPNDVVSLRGITVQVPLPYQAGISGIAFLNGAGLHLDNAVIAVAATFGLLFDPGAAAHLHVFDSRISASAIGVEMTAGSGLLRGVFDRVEVHDGNEGIRFGGPETGPIRGTVRNSLIANHFGFGVYLYGPGPKGIMIDRSSVVNGNNGIEGSGAGTIWVGDSVFSGQSTNPGTAGVMSYGTNKVVGGIDGLPIPNTIPLK